MLPYIYGKYGINKIYINRMGQNAVMATLREQYPLDDKKPLKKTIEGVFSFIIVIIVFGFSFFSSIVSANSAVNFSFWAILIIAIIIAYVVLKYIYEIFYLRHYFYDMANSTLIIRKGVFSRNEIVLPINRLQDVYVDQDILDRIFGLYDLHVSSATAISGNLSHIDGLDKQGSDAIKSLILSGIHQAK
jgi:membrane protein YdbS with pleckstrin-like domain